MNTVAQKGILVLTALLVGELLWAGQPKNSSADQQRSVPKQQNATQGGERVFQVQCSRCHHAPEQIPPSIAGTILRHMRVRALLTQEDERLLMKYLAP